MDPISQAVIGAALPQSVAKKSHMRWALLAGAAGGMAPDLDVVIRSSEDPLLFLEFHRQFTHSLFFIPFGGVIVAAALWPFAKKSIAFRYLCLFTTLGYATHGLLDACTSYGTQLFWPFSNMRVAWNNIGIIDPIPTLTALVAVLAAAYWKSIRWARFGFLFFIAYLLFGLWQREKAADIQAHLIESRGHGVVRKTVKPTIANLVIWRSIYEDDAGRFYIDGIRAPFWGDGNVYEGGVLEKVVPERDFAFLPAGSRQREDIERFRWFSKDFIAKSPENPFVIGDVRYGLLPNDISPMWGIEIDAAKPEQHVRFETFRSISKEAREEFLGMIFGGDVRSTMKPALR